MKRFAKSHLGVTLLEIMLVLAIAAMIIVMSVRYYQSAVQSQQVNSFIEQVQGVTAIVDSIAQGTGSYSTITQAQVTPLLPGGANAFNVPWGGAMGISFSANGFTLTPPKPSAAVCSLISARLMSNNHYVVSGDCTSVAYVTNP